MSRLRPASPDLRRELRAIADRTLTEEEVRAYLAAPLSMEQKRETLALVDWFCRRYPTGADRLAYVRRAYRRWSTRTLNE
jgi:hypothetical protein